MTDTRIDEIRDRADAATPGHWDEEWASVPETPGYEVSDHGNVRSYLKPGNHKRKHADRPRLLAQSTRTDGRRTIGLPTADGRTTTRSVARLVMLTFVGPCPPGLEVAHLNGDAGDNRLVNLKYVTHKENESHKRAHGTVTVGERNGAALLLGWQVSEIKYLADKGIPQARIADLFQVRRQVVNNILLGKRWSHVEAREDVPFLLDRVTELEEVLIELWARVDDAGSLMSTGYVREALGPRPANCRETRNYHPSRGGGA
jgi:hypothetical protein